MKHKHWLVFILAVMSCGAVVFGSADRSLGDDDFYVIPVAQKAVSERSKWITVHGSQGWVSGSTSYLDKSVNGLSVEPAGSSEVWVHFAIPALHASSTGYTCGARYIKLHFAIWTVGPCEFFCPMISTVTVRNGKSVLKTFTVDWLLTDYKTETLDLGSTMLFPDGMLISVKLEWGLTELGIFSFVSAGAYFIATSS